MPSSRSLETFDDWMDTVKTSEIVSISERGPTMKAFICAFDRASFLKLFSEKITVFSSIIFVPPAMKSSSSCSKSTTWSMIGAEQSSE